MANSIAYTKNYTAVLDEVYRRAACSTCLNSPRRMARAGRNAKEIMVPKIDRYYRKTMKPRPACSDGKR